MRATCRILALLAVCATAFAVPPNSDLETKRGYVLLLESANRTHPPGWHASADPVPEGGTFLFLFYLEPPTTGFDLEPFRGHYCEMKGRLEKDAIDNLTGRGAHDVFHLTKITVVPEDALRGPILDDLEKRGVDFFRDGSPEPTGGLTPDRKCSFGERVITLTLVPLLGPDHYRTSATTCLDGGVYWAMRAGGYAGTTHWVGPFELPGVSFTPARVKPDGLRVRKKVRRKTLRIFRAGEPLPTWAGDEFVPGDFDFGPGVTVTKVRRANKRRIKVRVEIAPDAPAGMRDVSVRDQTAADALEVRPRR